MSIDYHSIFPCVFRKMVWPQAVQLPHHCWRGLTRRTTGELFSACNTHSFTHIFKFVLSLQWHKPLTCVFCIHPLVLHEQTGCMAATKLVCTVLIINASEASGPLTDGRALKMDIWWHIKYFVAQKGGSRNPLWTFEPLLPTGQNCIILNQV